MSPLHVTRTPAPPPARGTVLALHGMMESGPTLRSAADTWAAAGWSVVAPDLRGHGRSPRWDPADRRHPGDRLAQDVVDLLDDLTGERAGHGPLVLFGHSAGGGVAAAAAVRRAGLVDGVVLEDPFWRLPVTRHQDPAVARQAHRGLVDRQAMTASELISWGRSRHPGWDPAELPEWAAAQHDADPALVRNGDVIPTPPWPQLLADLAGADVPVQVVTGSGPLAGMTVEHRRLLVARGAHLVVVPDANHFVRRDAPEAFARATTAFLERVAAR
ncbi:alpha/beta fold hydrolase [Myceligenerans indicum]|uniref:Alpha/beta fold hydrolase n=1 Tax=Myceligenerans indicum TaxID=2593663 RepID=A0ABS1LN00_9MICO|nr:alpha/beta fold hydrolase [Myceligenerans indicum]MBL0886937.1 alpha/beta fold hydrolase [Myceligenerans indicum]